MGAHLHVLEARRLHVMVVLSHRRVVMGHQCAQIVYHQNVAVVQDQSVLMEVSHRNLMDKLQLEVQRVVAQQEVDHALMGANQHAMVLRQHAKMAMNLLNQVTVLQSAQTTIHQDVLMLVLSQSVLMEAHLLHLQEEDVCRWGNHLALMGHQFVLILNNHLYAVTNHNHKCLKDNHLNAQMERHPKLAEMELLQCAKMDLHLKDLEVQVVKEANHHQVLKV